ncbi:glycosyltransferase family 4 protein [Alkalicoccus luteus]|uniref:Glycosyltransferase family 4 protein n=1 Tax=Alkalicoccus luteus TaxID=1237094 RepID=A0A969PVN7_9BACI|nr:glycosyltransferase family 4 protein [Alkalicoccus luteus]NJP38763.1 glycosyltransferase family 4 protein [Alkalicoccus luteus]
MKKILLIATVSYHFNVFHLPFIRWLKQAGWEVHAAAGGAEKIQEVDRQITLPISRSPMDRNNAAAFQQLKRLLETEQYDIVHAHTPVGGVLGRLAARNVPKTKLFYTAHGFHFCSGSPLSSWLMYYPVERLCARWTDTLITINEEDYKRAVTHRFPAGRIVHVHGVGIEKTDEVNTNIRQELGISDDADILFYAAELNKNKNQRLLAEMLSYLKHPVHLVLAGSGDPEPVRQAAFAHGTADRVHFLGNRQDVPSLYRQATIAVASSLREGLPVNVMEAMSAETPVVAVSNRGHRELLAGCGLLVGRDKPREFAAALDTLLDNPELAKDLARKAKNKLERMYTSGKVINELAGLYREEAGIG